MHYKVTLDSGKVVELRPLRVKDYKLAAEASSHRAKGNQTLLGLYMQDEIMKQLIQKIDDKPLDGLQREQIESIFDATEYRQVLMVIEEMVGEANRPKVEMITTPQS
jgi:hypothetical protein